MNGDRHPSMGRWSLGLSVANGTVFLSLLPLARSFAAAEANDVTTGM